MPFRFACLRWKNQRGCRELFAFCKLSPLAFCSAIRSVFFAAMWCSHARSRTQRDTNGTRRYSTSTAGQKNL